MTLPVEALGEAGLAAGDAVIVRALGAGRIEIRRRDDVIAELAGSLSYPPGCLDELRDEWERGGSLDGGQRLLGDHGSRGANGPPGPGRALCRPLRIEIVPVDRELASVAAELLTFDSRLARLADERAQS